MNAIHRKFNVSSVGELYMNSIEMFAEKITDMAGNAIPIENIEVGQKVFVFFSSGTGLTRTSAKRIL